MSLKDLLKRIITAIFLIIFLALSFYNFYILVISLIFISFISFIEFRGLISKIIQKKKLNNIYLRYIINLVSLVYIIIFSLVVFTGISEEKYKITIFYLFCVCICSDIGGLLFGKIFKGKKLTKISPNKTISGTIGSFILSLILVPIFYFSLEGNIFNLINFIFITLFVSLFCQIGDLFISFLKRKAQVKDTGKILPGHGGFLDRIDGMLLAIPVGILIFKFFEISI